MTNIKFIIFFSTFLITAIASAQNNDVHKTDSSGFYKLTDVVISASKTSSSTLELANSITVIDSAQIINSNQTNVFDLLKSEYGLSVTQPGGQGALSTINIRGSNPEHVLVLIDGIEMNMTSDAANVYDFANLPVEQVNRIEILRGPQSTLYGSDALAGVVNIITNKGTGNSTLLLSAEGGSYKSFKGSAGVSGSFNDLNFVLSYARIQSDGFSASGEKYGNTESDGYAGNNFSSRIGYDFNKQSGMNFYFRYTKAKTDLDQFGGKFGDDPSYIYNLEEFTTRAEGYFNLFDGLWDQKLGVSYHKNLREYNFDSTLYNPASSDSKYDGKKYKLDWQNNFNLFRSNILSAGIDFETEEAESEYYYNSSFGPYESLIPKHQVSTTGFYLLDQLNIDNRIFTSVGIRYDHHEKFGGAVTYRISPAYIFWQTGTKLKFNIGNAFKAPSIFYLYDPVFGNENLNPEENFGWDAGIEQYLWSDGISIGINYFANNFTDLFGTDENFKTINIEEAETNGIEFFTKANLMRELDFKFNYTFTHSEDKSETSPDYNQKLLRRPEHKIALLINSDLTEKVNINFEIIYTGEREDKNFSSYPVERVVLADYTLINIAAHYDLLEFLRIYGRIDNLLDKQYEEIYGYGTPGFSVYGGINLRVE